MKKAHLWIIVLSVIVVVACVFTLAACDGLITPPSGDNSANVTPDNSGGSSGDVTPSGDHSDGNTTPSGDNTGDNSGDNTGDNTGDNSGDNSGNNSGNTTPDPVALAAPVVTVSADGAATWQAVTGATGYRYKINDGTVQTTTNALVTLHSGESLTVQAVGDGVATADSAWSEAVTYSPAIKLTAPTLTIGTDGSVSWTEVTGATGYMVDVNGTQFQYTDPITLMDGEKVRVKALGDGVNYTDSNWCPYRTYYAPAQKLATPNPYFAEGEVGVLRWAAITGAIRYKVFIYSIYWSEEQIAAQRETSDSWSVKTVSTNELVVDDMYITYDAWRFEVQAIGNGTSRLDSDWSSPIAYDGQQPTYDIPVMHFANDTGLVTWAAIDGAEGYWLTVYGLDGAWVASVSLDASTTSYQMNLDTYIVISADNWRSSSGKLYYIESVDPGYSLTYSEGAWSAKPIRVNGFFTEEALYLITEMRVNGGEPFTEEEATGLVAGDVVEVRYPETDGAWRSVTIGACAHPDYRYYPLVLPTETSAGHRAYYQCVDCGAVWEYGLDYWEAYYDQNPDAPFYYGPLTYVEYSDFRTMHVWNDIVRDHDHEVDGSPLYIDIFRPLAHEEVTEWLYDEDAHWAITYCHNCGQYEISADKIPHVFEDGVCTVCGYDGVELFPVAIDVASCATNNGEVTVNAYYDQTYHPEDYIGQVTGELDWTPGLADFIVLYEGANAILAPGGMVSLAGWDTWYEDGVFHYYYHYDYYYNDQDACGYAFHGIIYVGGVRYYTGFGLDILGSVKGNDRVQIRRVTVISRNGVVVTKETTNQLFGIDYIEIAEGQEIAVGATAPVEYEVRPGKDVLQTLTWTSSDDSILSIDAAGNMTAHSAGTVTATVETNPYNTYSEWSYLQIYGHTLTSSVTVTVLDEILPESMSVARDELTMTTKNPYQMAVSFLPAGSLAAVSFESSDESVATVDAEGLVTALSAGETTITVTSANGLVATTHITVEVYDLLEKTPLSYTLTDLYDQALYGNNTPLEGELHLLVLPVYFPESSEDYNYDRIRADLEIAFFGDPAYNGYDTVKSYYEAESMGKLTITGTVADWYRVPRSANKLWNNVNGVDATYYDVADLATWAVAEYRRAHTVDGVAPSLSEYDNDGDGYLDGVIVIYAYPSKGERDADGKDIPDIFWPAVHHFGDISGYGSGRTDPSDPVVGRTVMFASPAWMYGYGSTTSYGREETRYSTDSYVGANGDYVGFEYMPEGARVLITGSSDTLYYWAYEREMMTYGEWIYDGTLDNDGAARYGTYDWENNGQPVGEVHGSGYHRYVDSRCFIHEMAHMFGINDYYDFNQHDESNEEYRVLLDNIDGGFNMQENNVGAHDPYSKLVMGWLDPYIITDECTIEINPIESSGDVILVSATGLVGNSPFDEYLLIELYTPTGLNEFDSTHFDSTYHLQGPQTAGCRIWHVDARLVDQYKHLVVDGVLDGSVGVEYATFNAFGQGVEGFKQFCELMLLRKDAAADEDAFWIQHVLDEGGNIKGDVYKPQEIVKAVMKVLQWTDKYYEEGRNNTYATDMDEIMDAMGRDAVINRLKLVHIDWTDIHTFADLEAYARTNVWELFLGILDELDIDRDASWADIKSAIQAKFGVLRTNIWNDISLSYDSEAAFRAFLENYVVGKLNDLREEYGYGVDDDMDELFMTLGAQVLLKEIDYECVHNIYESKFSADNLFVTGDTFTMERYAGAFYNPGLLDSGLELGWAIHFDYVDSDRAIITFTRVA